MLIEDLNNLLEKYDKLRSIANSGSSDKDITSRFKSFRRVFEYKLLKKFSISAYAFPFASQKIRKEIRYTLYNILKLCEIDYLRTERTNQFSKDAIVMIKKYLEEMPPKPSWLERLNDNSWNILACVVGIVPLILSIGLPTAQILLIVVGLAILLPSLLPYMIFKGLIYIEELRWFRKWMNKLAIANLKQKIITDLVHHNDKTYDELNEKYR